MRRVSNIFVLSFLFMVSVQLNPIAKPLIIVEGGKEWAPFQFQVNTGEPVFNEFISTTETAGPIPHTKLLSRVVDVSTEDLQLIGRELVYFENGKQIKLNNKSECKARKNCSWYERKYGFENVLFLISNQQSTSFVSYQRDRSQSSERSSSAAELLQFWVPIIRECQQDAKKCDKIRINSNTHPEYYQTNSTNEEFVGLNLMSKKSLIDNFLRSDQFDGRIIFIFSYNSLDNQDFDDEFLEKHNVYYKPLQDGTIILEQELYSLVVKEEELDADDTNKKQLRLLSLRQIANLHKNLQGNSDHIVTFDCSFDDNQCLPGQTSKEIPDYKFDFKNDFASGFIAIQLGQSGNADIAKIGYYFNEQQTLYPQKDAIPLIQYNICRQFDDSLCPQKTIKELEINRNTICTTRKQNLKDCMVFQELKSLNAKPNIDYTQLGTSWKQYKEHALSQPITSRIVLDYGDNAHSLAIQEFEKLFEEALFGLNDTLTLFFSIVVIFCYCLALYLIGRFTNWIPFDFTYPVYWLAYLPLICIVFSLGLAFLLPLHALPLSIGLFFLSLIYLLVDPVRYWHPRTKNDKLRTVFKFLKISIAVAVILLFVGILMVFILKPLQMISLSIYFPSLIILQMSAVVFSLLRIETIMNSGHYKLSAQAYANEYFKDKIFQNRVEEYKAYEKQFPGRSIGQLYKNLKEVLGSGKYSATADLLVNEIKKDQARYIDCEGKRDHNDLYPVFKKMNHAEKKINYRNSRPWKRINMKNHPQWVRGNGLKIVTTEKELVLAKEKVVLKIPSNAPFNQKLTDFLITGNLTTENRIFLKQKPIALRNLLYEQLQNQDPNRFATTEMQRKLIFENPSNLIELDIDPPPEEQIVTLVDFAMDLITKQRLIILINAFCAVLAKQESS